MTGCALYRQGDVISFPMGVYHVPPIHAGLMVDQPTTVGEDYLGPMGFLVLTGRERNSANFEVGITSGLPPTEAERSGPRSGNFVRISVEGLAYRWPGYALGALAAAPIGEPRTVAAFEAIDPGLGGFSELLPAGTADYVLAERQIFAELDTSGTILAILSCLKPGVVPNPTCILREQVGVFATSAWFVRPELARLD